MKVRKFGATEEKSILTAMIVNANVLGKIHQELGNQRDGPFKSKWSNLVARWCFDYYQSESKAPGKRITDLFDTYAAKEPEDESIQVAEKFLAGLSGEYAKLKEDLNESWVLKKAAEHFETVRYQRLSQQLETATDAKDINRAREVWAEGTPLSFSGRGWDNPFTTINYNIALDDRDKAKPLVRWQGDLGKFMSDQFVRGGFVSFTATEKMGKSFWLSETAFLGLTQGRKVVYYMLGDMSQRQAYNRIFTRATMRPRLPKERNEIKMPLGIKVAMKKDERPVGTVDFDVVKKRPWTMQDLIEAEARIKMKAARKEIPIRFVALPGGVITASQIRTDVRNLMREGWEPDVVVIDYADELAAEPSMARQDVRHQIDMTWRILRQVSLENDILVVTATQAAARNYDKWLMKKGDFSEAKRKNAHITGNLGINRMPEEKEQGLYRLNWTFLRDGVWSENQFVWVAGNLALACPCITSLLKLE